MAKPEFFNSEIPCSSFFPLYLSPSEATQLSLEEKLRRISELSPEILSRIENNLQLSFLSENESTGNLCMANAGEVRDDFKTSFTPVDLLDYMYGVFHSSGYGEKAGKLLKTDFLKVPYPEDPGTFWQLVRSGGKLRVSRSR